MRRNLYKIDKALLQAFALEETSLVNCLVHVQRFEQAKDYFLANGYTITAEFPFIQTFAMQLREKQLHNICDLPCVSYVSQQAKVSSLVYLSKKILHVDNRFQGKGIGVCYIDTGIAPHLDFTLGKNRILKFVDLINHHTKPYDDNGHGTFVAGVGSGGGVVSCGKYSGIAPASNIIAIKALDQNGEASAIKILDAMQWVYDHYQKYHIKVVCMSFGSEPLGFNDPIMKGAEELWRKGIVIVAAAGNSGPEFETIKSPGVSSRIITVGGMNDNRLSDDEYRREYFEIAHFSSRGPALRQYKPDLVAPAVNIISCSHKKVPYKRLSGTSVATPMVAGLVANLLEKDNSLTPDKIKKILKASCQPICHNSNLEGNGYPTIHM